jgi:uncharacterized protein YraI
MPYIVIYSLFALVLAGLAQSALAAPAGEPAAASDPPSATVITGRLNVRAGPGATYTVITQVDFGQVLSLFGRNAAATWVNVGLPSGIEGWVSARYISAGTPLADLAIVGAAPLDFGATVTSSQLELRSGSGVAYSVLANLGRGHALWLLGRTADSAWVKVQAAGHGEGWVVTQVTVVLPGNEQGVPIPTFRSTMSVNSLPVLGTTGAPQVRVSVSPSDARPATPVLVTVSGFPADRDIAAVLTSRLMPNGFVVASGHTDANGSAQLFFRMPDMWPNGVPITETGLSLAVGTNDGSTLIWNGLRYSPT